MSVSQCHTAFRQKPVSQHLEERLANSLSRQLKTIEHIGTFKDMLYEGR